MLLKRTIPSNIAAVQLVTLLINQTVFDFCRAAQLCVAVDAPPAHALPRGQPHHRHHERLIRRTREARGARHLTDQG